MTQIREIPEGDKNIEKIDRDYKLRIKKVLMENMVFFSSTDCEVDKIDYWEECNARNDNFYELINEWKSKTNGIVQVNLMVHDERSDNNIVMPYLGYATSTLYDGNKRELDINTLPVWGFADEEENLNFWRRYFQLLYFVKQEDIHVNYVDGEPA